MKEQMGRRKALQARFLSEPVHGDFYSGIPAVMLATRMRLEVRRKRQCVCDARIRADLAPPLGPWYSVLSAQEWNALQVFQALDFVAQGDWPTEAVDHAKAKLEATKAMVLEARGRKERVIAELDGLVEDCVEKLEAVKDAIKNNEIVAKGRKHPKYACAVHFLARSCESIKALQAWLFSAAPALLSSNATVMSH